MSSLIQCISYCVFSTGKLFLITIPCYDLSMIEVHPFKNFIPQRMQYLVLGSFTAKNAHNNPNYDWYYSNGRNHFWPIIEKVYGVGLPDKGAKMELFRTLHIGITDIIHQCDRRENNSLDTSLVDIIYNTAISDVIVKNPVKSIFFTSRFVERHYHKAFKKEITNFPDINLVTLPSPSPRYARMSKDEKVRTYRVLLPAL